LNEILHIYAQSSWHDNATIAGTPESLKALRGAIDTAIQKGVAKCDSFVNDGEGYTIIVQSMSADEAERIAAPYTDEIASEKGGRPFP